MAPRVSLRAFLATARAALTAPASSRTTPLTFVVGNESADLDSLCSAIILAYLRTYTAPHRLHIPLCHLARADLALRPEFAAALAAASASADDVPTLSELPGDLPAAQTRWLLVDHNALTGELGRRYADRVLGCVDHHEDEGVVPTAVTAADADDEPLRVIERSGSCMSLIITRYQAAWDALAAAASSGNDDADANAGPEIDRQLALLALGPVLLDTSMLRNADKTTAFDTSAVDYLEAKIGAVQAAGAGQHQHQQQPGGGDGDGAYARRAYHKQLNRLKKDLSALSVRDILRKDYKQWDESGLRLGMSTVPQRTAYLVDKAGGDSGLLAELGAWAEHKGLHLVVLMTTFSSKDGAGAGADAYAPKRKARELLVWARTEAAVQAAKVFERDHGHTLALKPLLDGALDTDGPGWRRLWQQGGLEYSRKQVAPMLRAAITASAKP